MQRRLDKLHHPTFTLHVVSEIVREDDSWWSVPVEARGTKIPPADFLYPAYATIEGDLSDELDLNVLIVPTLATEQTA